MKIAPFIRQIQAYNQLADTPIEHFLVHTGQHYDDALSGIFFEELGIPQPDYNLNIGSGSHGEQLGKTMMAFEEVCQKLSPDWVVVIGDVNATLSCSVIAKRLGIKVCHIESGLRSFDMRMPEEINRLVTDRLSDLLLTPDHMSTANLKKEGKADEAISMVGNIMIDSLVAKLALAEKEDPAAIIAEAPFGQSHKQEHIHEKVMAGQFAMMTMHRPSNVDDKSILAGLVQQIGDISEELPVLFTVHPRTEKQLRQFELWDELASKQNILLLKPLRYLQLLKMNTMARLFITDSGGLQEECCYLGTPCITLRENTERPITLQEHGGVSVLTGNDPDLIKAAFDEMLKLERSPARPEYWDGHTAERCLNAILNFKIN